MSEEVEFTDQKELKKELLDSYLESYLEHTNLTADQVMLREFKSDKGDVFYEYVKKTEKK